MAEKSIHQKGNLDKMAVNSVDHRVESQAKDEYAKESIESLQSKGLQRAKSMEGHPTKKKGSFQITRVIPKSSGLNDPDQDSVDDIDETNTEDVSSDILDISKNTDIDPDPSSNDTVQSLAPEEFGLPSVKEAGKGLPQQSHSQPQVGVESSTQQYNMSVSSVLASTSQTTLHQSQASPVSVTQQQQEDGHVKINDMQSRFKLVKIESREPFKRGRWTCLDFLDPPPSDKDKGLERADRSLDEIGSGNSSASSSIHYIHGVDDPSKNPIAVNVVHAEGHTVLEPQPIHAVPPQSQLQNGDFIPQQVMSVPSVITNGGIPTQPFVTDANGGPGPDASTQPIPSMPSQTKQPLPSQQVPTSQTGHLQNIVSSTQAPNLDLDVQQYPKSAIPTQTVSSSTKDPTVVKSHPSQTQVHPTIPQAQIQQSQSSQLQIDQNLPPQDYLHPQAEFDSSQNLSKTEFNTLPANPTHTTAPQQSLNTSQTSNVDFVAQSGAAATSGPSTNTSPNNENVAGEFGTSDSLGYVPTTRAEDKKVHLSTKLDKDSVLGSMAKLAGMQQSYLSPPFLEMAVSATMQPAQAVTKDDDESGASTVAIDNKIEQAMDLVKSHLMFAVREEVEVLREQIKDLIEKNNQLEYENQILKSAATAETLAQLQQPKPPTHTQPPTSSS